jgi:carboxymethylenebutenolidase
VEPTKPKLPSEAIELYNDFIHGEISRRAFLEGVQRLAGGLAAATVINALMPNYALGQQVSRTDDRIKAAYEIVPSPKGNGSIKGYLVRPISADIGSETVTKLPGVIVIHETPRLLLGADQVAHRPPARLRSELLFVTTNKEATFSRFQAHSERRCPEVGFGDISLMSSKPVYG